MDAGRGTMSGVRKVARRTPLFLGFNTVLALLVALFQYENFGKQFSAWQYIAMTQILTHAGVLGAVWTGFPLGDWLQKVRPNYSYMRVMLLLLPATTIAALLSIGLGILLTELLLGVRPFTDWKTYFYMSFLPTVLVSITVTFVLGKFEFGNSPADAAPAEPVPEGLSCKVGANIYFVPFGEIIYLSSHGRFTVVHAAAGEYKLSRLLKDVLEQLPSSDFMRIHKSYVVALPYLSHAQYMIGGTYVVYLKDGEETTLPVGRKYTAELKRVMGMK